MDDQYGSPTLPSADAQLARQSFLTTVFGWMFLGLALTAGIAAWIAATTNILDWFEDNSIAFFVLLFGQLGLVIAISAGINRISYSTAVFLFALYAALNGFLFSILFSVYTASSIGAAFAVSAGMFGSMAAYGYITKRDLSGLRSILFMGLIGLLIGLVVNMFWANSTLYWFVTFGGVLLFCALTAYDMQKIKRIGESGISGEAAKKATILGALSLYLDFINLFLFMLRIFGSAR
jgi:FtsH-binding integral membrane protein